MAIARRNIIRKFYLNRCNIIIATITNQAVNLEVLNFSIFAITQSSLALITLYINSNAGIGIRKCVSSVYSYSDVVA